MPSPFFIVGVPRSGTTLLAVLLNNHSRLFLDRKAIAIRTLDFRQRVERSIARNPGERAYVIWRREAAKDSRLQDFLHWPILDHQNDLTLQEFVERSLEIRAQAHGKVLLGDKSPDAVTRLPELLSLFPNARLVVMIRDARPNVRSLVKRQYLPLRVAAQRWKDWNATALAARQWLGPGRIHLVRYEDLLREPETTLEAVNRFLGVGFEATQLDLATAPATQTEGAYVKPTIDVAAIDSWKESISPSEQAAIENTCGTWLDHLGYEVEPTRRGNANLGFWTDYRLRVVNAVRLLFRPKRLLMQDQQLKEVRLPLSNRLYVLAATIVGGVLRRDLLERISGKQ